MCLQKYNVLTYVVRITLVSNQRNLPASEIENKQINKMHPKYEK